MKTRHLLIIALTLIAILSFVAFIISKYIQPTLSADANLTFLLAIAAVMGSAAFLAAFKDIVELAEKLLGVKSDQEAAITGNLIHTIASYLAGGSEVHHIQRARQVMLKMVKDFWVKGVLEQSLHGNLMIELGLETHPEFVKRAWEMVLQLPDLPSRSIPPGVRIMDVFDEIGGSLLILGEPGSGKTISLLELARDTICRAEADPLQPIPVVFNLSSWATDRKSITDWLIDELALRYNVPPGLSRNWIDQDNLLLLLDGLDEVNASFRVSCVEALNRFQNEHGLMPLVICCRIGDYVEIGSQLRLNGAVTLLPLTSEQIRYYLAAGSSRLPALNHMLMRDPALQELARSPLMLSVMALTFRDATGSDLMSASKKGDYRTRILDAYINNMFGHRCLSQRYSREHTLHWVAWLAYRMSKADQSMFLLEQMQSTWLANYKWEHDFLVALVFVPVIFVIVGPTMVPFLIAEAIDLFLPMKVSITTVSAVLAVSMAFIIALLPSRVEPVETLHMSWSMLLHGIMRQLRSGWKSTLLIAGAILFVLTRKYHYDLLELLATAIVLILAALLSKFVFSLDSGLTIGNLSAKKHPNEGIRNSAKYALMLWLVFGVLGFLIFLPLTGIGSALRIGLSVGTTISLLFGGLATIEHIALRVLVFCHGHTPLNYVRFLDYSVDLGFLRRVGGGYIFVHSELQRYFARLSERTHIASMNARM